MKLNDVFNIDAPEPTQQIHGDVITTTGEVILATHTSATEKVEHDYNTSRSNLHALLVQGQDALMHALEIAKSSEHPRAFEVVGGLMKQLSDINGQLLDLSEKHQKLIDSPKQPTETITNNNAIFVGSTTDLNKLLRDMTGGIK